MDLSLLEAPARVSAVRVDGAPRTRRPFLGAVLSGPLSAPRPATLEGALLAARDAGAALHATGIFSAVSARLEPAAADGDVDIVFKTKERGRYYLKTSTEVGNNEGTASATGHVRNVFGGAEHLEASVAAGTKTRRAFNALFSAPLSGRTLDTRAELSAYAADKDNSSFASSTEAVRGAKLAVRHGERRGGQHELGYEAVLRHVGALTESASLSVREAAGPSFKSALFHAYTRDTRDRALHGTRGSFLRVRHELAGVGAGAAFYKLEGEAQAARALADGVTLSLGARAGVLRALDGTPSLQPDRFQLGGPQTLRAFRANSLGPRDGPDSLGGDLMWAVGASVVSDIPRLRTWPIKLHAFVNAGQLDSLQNATSLQDAVRASIAQPSVSAGVGLVYALEPVRVELNFGVPLAARASDGARRGVQMGIGLEFL